ncbi:FAD-dependent oxidoreductase [Nocardia sp. NBC_01388]|uniref:NAD(P)/FAD-dependent oxidoreductase n=1 Tax=Nocardia sp. NBC_01388 TaxID=2903596 RepID=UPI003250C9A6
MTDTAEFLIIGGGLEGLAIAWSLAERGATDIVLLERNSLCSGMTGKSSGVVRCHYGAPSLAAMSWWSVPFFENATEILGDDLGFRQCGYAVGVGADNLDPLKANVAMQQALGIEVDLLAHDDMAALWPGLRVDDFAAFAYEPRGGRGEAYLTGMAFAAAARARGVRIRQQTPVVELLTAAGRDGASAAGRDGASAAGRDGASAAGRDGASAAGRDGASAAGRDGAIAAGRVIGAKLADGTELHAGTVVLAAGPWTPALAATAGVDVPVRAQRAQLIMIDQGEPLPQVPVLSDLVSLQYLCREPNGELLAGNSDHAVPEYLDPDDFVNRADDSTVEKVVGRLEHRLPQMPDPRITGSYVGAYDVTPDYNPIIGPAPAPGLFLATGFSGHGFKISPAVGRLVADLLLHNGTELPNVDAADFRYERFAEGRPLLSPHPYVGAGEMR